MMRTMELMQTSQSKQYQYTIIPTRMTNGLKHHLKRIKLCRIITKTKYGRHVPVDTKFRDASLAQQVPTIFAPFSSVFTIAPA